MLSMIVKLLEGQTHVCKGTQQARFLRLDVADTSCPAHRSFFQHRTGRWDYGCVEKWLQAAACLTAARLTSMLPWLPLLASPPWSSPGRCFLGSAGCCTVHQQILGGLIHVCATHLRAYQSEAGVAFMRFWALQRLQLRKNLPSQTGPSDVPLSCHNASLCNVLLQM